MRWSLGLLLCLGCTRTPLLVSSNMERICFDAPYHDPVPTQVIEWLRQERVLEHRGWRVTAEWLNEQCATVPGVHRVRLAQ